jgi:hypothetical protein
MGPSVLSAIALIVNDLDVDVNVDWVGLENSEGLMQRNSVE